MDEWFYWGTGLALLNVGLAIYVTVHAVLWKRDSRAVISWVGLAWLAPIVGSAAYLALGVNRISRKAISLNFRDSRTLQQLSGLSREDRQKVVRLMREYPYLDGLVNAGHHLGGAVLVGGNAVEPLIDGDAAYPAMIEAIDGAQRSVALLSYIFDSDRAGELFFRALVAARKRGVQVRVIIDDVGSKYSSPNMVQRLREADVKCAAFFPSRFGRLPTNMRNHRKILVVDGELGFTGGTNIREGHVLGLSPKTPVQCVHFKLRGAVVSQLQRVFALDWAYEVGELLSGADWFPDVQRAGPVWARGIEHGPDENFERLPLLIAAALASARRRVRIVTPYFLPNASLIQALNVAALRGVQVEVYIPSKNNIPVVQWATTAQLWQILENGVHVYQTAAPFDHTKLMIVDGIWSLIGSTNWDPRSLRLNFEFNVECYDPALASELNDIVDGKAAGSREVTLDEVNSRSFPVRLRDGMARLLTPYL